MWLLEGIRGTTLTCRRKVTILYSMDFTQQKCQANLGDSSPDQLINIEAHSIYASKRQILKEVKS